MPQPSQASKVLTCPFCGYPYPMSDMQRELYIGRNMGCMNCGRPFKVEAPPQPDPEPIAPAEPAAADTGAAASVEAAAPAPPAGQPPASPAAPRTNPPAVIGFGGALLFFALIAAATVVSAAIPDADNGVDRSGTMPHTPAGILTALAIVSGILAVLFSAAGLVRTLGTTRTHGVARTTGRGMAIAGLAIGGGGLLITAILLSTVVPLVKSQRLLAKRDECKANLQTIAASLASYANSSSNSGAHYPDSLAQLVGSGALAPEALVCPATADTPAPGATPILQATALGQSGHQSYVYAGKGLTAAAPASAVLVYEPATNHGDVAHVLFRDGMIVPAPATFADQIRGELAAGKNPGSTARSLHP